MVTPRSRFHDSVGAVVEALHIGSARRISWFGRDLDELGLLPADLAGEALTSFISGVLYQSYYVYGAPQDDVTVADQQTSTLSRSSRFLDRLLAANRGTREWALDCPVERGDGDRMTAHVWGIRFAVPADVGAAVSDRGTLSIRMPGVLAMNSPGYVMFFGDRGPQRADGQAVRLYWNVTAPGAAELVSALTGTLNEAAVPFQLKVRYSDQPWPDRADPAVLYLDRDDLARCWKRIAAVGHELRPLLRPYTPALTRPLAHGLGFAEDPGGNASYGTAVCDLIAAGLVDAHRRGETAAEHRVSRVEQAFTRAGRTVAAPYLEPGSTELELRSPTEPASRRRRRDTVSSDDWVATADGLGRRISAQALWSGDRCTWLQPSLDPGDNTLRPASAEVYDGLAGIGLLFAELSRVTGDGQHSRTAYAALSQATDIAERLPDLGLYAGSPGVGLAVALAGRALDDERLFTEGAALVRKRSEACLRDGRTDRSDLVYGVAGAVVALVRLHRLGDVDAAELAVRLGQQLVANAVPTDDGCYWVDDENAADGSRTEPAGLTGMAHGGSGAVWALSELAESTGESAFARCAKRACAYEWTRFDDTVKNWPDVRPAARRAGSRRNRYDWCYGAPGILLSRIRLHAVTGWHRAAADMDVALSGTRAAAAAFPKYGYGVGMCHGAAGLADILSLLPASLSGPDDDRVRRDLVAAAADAFRADGPWPDGCGLMLGAAGVALAALRIEDPAVPSPLWWAPPQGAAR